MVRKLLVYFIIFFSGTVIRAAEPGDTSRLRLSFAGDLMGHDDQINTSWNSSENRYKYDTCFSEIKDYVSNADLSFVNLEVTLAGPPYKGYPQFSSPDELAIAAKNAGFDVFLTANNHSLDRGKKGLERTIAQLDSFGIIHTGTFTDSAEREARYPLILEKNNFRLAILNYTYGTNGIAVTQPNIVNYIDTAIIRSDLAKAELTLPDFTIVTVHWGTEYQPVENKEQQALADFMIKNGADIIIGSHPHVIQPVREYATEADSTGKNIVVYSLGNLISNQRERYRNGGLIFTFDLEKTDTTRVVDYETYPVYVHKTYPETGKHYVLLPVNQYEEMLEKYSLNPADLENFRIFKEDTELKLNIK